MFFCIVDLPAVTRDWLTDCYKHKRRIPVKYYLLGDAISPANDVEEDEEHADIDVQLGEFCVDVSSFPLLNFW